MSSPSRDLPPAQPPPAERGGELHPVPPGHYGREDTGLPLLRTWPAVYSLVVAVFVLWVTLLILFMRFFS
jgi:hypothetical protein